jgi:hypothetical protein
MLPSYPKLVMAGHSPSKTGVGRPDVPAIHVLAAKEVVDARHKAGHDGGESAHHVA